MMDDSWIVYWLEQLATRPTVWIGHCPQDDGGGVCGATGAIFIMSHPGQQIRVLCTACRRRSIIQAEFLSWDWDDL